MHFNDHFFIIHSLGASPISRDHAVIDAAKRFIIFCSYCFHSRVAFSLPRFSWERVKENFETFRRNRSRLVDQNHTRHKTSWRLLQKDQGRVIRKNDPTYVSTSTRSRWLMELKMLYQVLETIWVNDFSFFLFKSIVDETKIKYEEYN